MVATAKKAKPAKKAQPKKELNPCTCGCGGKTGSRFVPGHDARMKGMLQRAFREGTLNADQKKLITTLGWERFMKPLDEDGKVVKGKETPLTIAQVNILRALAKSPAGLTKLQMRGYVGGSIAMVSHLGPDSRDEIAAVEKKAERRTLLGLKYVTFAPNGGEGGTLYVITAAGKKALESCK